MKKVKKMVKFFLLFRFVSAPPIMKTGFSLKALVNPKQLYPTCGINSQPKKKSGLFKAVHEVLK